MGRRLPIVLAVTLVVTLVSAAPDHARVLPGTGASVVEAAPVRQTAASPVVDRLAGSDRIATAVAVSRATHTAADTAVVATSASYPDALSGSVLAASVDAPLLLTTRDEVPVGVLRELERLDVGRVVVLGGTAAVGPAAVAQLSGSGRDVTRIAGADRYETAARVATELGGRGTVALATGEDFPDAVAVSAYAAFRGWPILLVERDRVPPPVAALLRDGTARAVPVGGTAAISDDVLAQVRRQGVDVTERLAGPTRWATSYRVAVAHRRALDGPRSIWLATGEAFPDALSAGPAAAARGAVLQLSPTASLDVPGSTADPAGFVRQQRACDGSGTLRTGTLVGGPVALRAHVHDQLTALLSCEAPPPPPPTATATLLAAGDIAECGSDDDDATAALLDDHPGATVAALGDLAYDDGTAEEFRECYGPSWGRHRDRTRPAIGNHEMDTDDGAPYYDYFGTRAGPSGRGWYSFDLSPSWHAIVLNSNCDDAGGCGPGSPQHDWLVADLRANRDQHVIAWMHHPRFSSGTRHGSDDDMQPVFGTLARHGADVLLTGHDHHYERFAPLDAAGRPARTGLASFVVGTGGRSLYELGDREAHSVVAEDRYFGVLRLVLRADGYAWRFLPVDPGVTVDAGTRTLPAP